jgi:dipeptidyl aminopeptidase/acylaminoacyl peptidase
MSFLRDPAPSHFGEAYFVTEKRRLIAEDLLALRLPGDPQLSPDGSRVAFVLQEMDKEKNEYRTAIWIAVQDGEPCPYTSGPKDSSPRWSPDGAYLAFLSNRSGSTQIWLLPTAGGEARQLTRIKGGCGNIAWSPDGKNIAFTANLTGAGIQPEQKDEEEKDLLKRHTRDVRIFTRLQYKMDGTGYFNGKRPQICWMPVEGGAAPLQLTAGDYSHGEPVWAPDGRHLLFVASRNEDADWTNGNDIWQVGLDGGEPQRLTPGDRALVATDLSVSPDGRLVAFLASRVEASGHGNHLLYLLNRATGTIRCVTEGFDRTLENVVICDLPGPASGRVTWSPDGNAVYLSCGDAGMVHLVRVNIASGKVVRLTGGDRVIYSFSFSPDVRRVAFAAAEADHPGDIYLGYLDQPAPAPPVRTECGLLTGGGIRESRLTQVNRELLAAAFVSLPERFNFRAGEGEPPIDGWLIRPAGSEPGVRYPAVLEIHGGPMAMYGGSFSFEFQLLAAQGYAVVFANPRGSQGYGEQFCHCVMADWGNRDYADVMAAIETAVARFDLIDRERLGVCGGSYGGFMVNWIVGHTDRFRAAVTGRSVVNRFSAMGTSDVGYLRIPQFQEEGYWWQNPEPYLKQSPLMHAHKINTPLLIEHQENDLRCPIEQGEQLYVALRLQQKPVKFVRYPGEFHGMSRTGKPWNRVHRLLQICDWFQQYLQPAPVPER